MNEPELNTGTLPPDYEQRTYAGVLGKIIGVYLGRPFEGWPNELIERRLGEIDYYVHDKVGVRLIVTDDDISGTFTFIRALEDNDYDPNLTPKQIGRSWLNYLIDGRSVLWWGGLGNSTEHTAYLRLVAGIDAPESGAIETNGQVVAEQIGAQIFIDGWAMVNPGDPQRAADFAKRAASVSHDGEAVVGAQILAAMEAQAYVEQDIDELIDTGLACVPKKFSSGRNDQRYSRLACGIRRRLAQDFRTTQRFVRLRQVRRKLSHCPQSWTYYFGVASRQWRLPSITEDCQYCRLGYGLQFGKFGMSHGNSQWDRRYRLRARLAWPDCGHLLRANRG